MNQMTQGGRVMAMARPAALPVPSKRGVQALTKPNVLERWAEESAGARALAVDEAAITIFDVIGDDWSEDGVTAEKVAAQLRAIGERPVEVHINSPGGNMFEGIAIYNMLREHPQPVTVKIVGLAASAASVIAMAGDRVEIGAASFLMIHNCWVMTIGNRHDLAAAAQGLEPFDAALAEVYAARSGRPRADVVQWMDGETWMSGASAVERGFADGLLAADQVTIDEGERAQARAHNDVRMMAIALVQAGHTPSHARERIAKIKAAPSAGPELLTGIAALAEAFRESAARRSPAAGVSTWQ